MTWLVFSLITFLSILILSKAAPCRNSGYSNKFVVIVFILKFLSGSALTLIYTYYYNERGAADIYKFFDDAQVIASALPEHPEHYLRLISGWDSENPELDSYRKAMRNWEPQSAEWLDFTKTTSYNFFTSNRIITRINALLIPVSGGNIFTHVLLFSLLITLASFAFINTLKFESAFYRHAAVAAILFWPSVMIWCSAPLKDALTLSAIFFSWSSLHRIVNNPSNFQQWIILGFWLMVLLFTKYYVLPAFLAAALLLTVQNYSNPLFSLRNSGLVIVAGVLAILVVEFSFPEKKLSVLLNNKREEALKAAIFGEARQMAFVGIVDGSTFGMIKETPKAILRAVFLPLYPQAQMPLIMLPALFENFLLLMLVFYTIALAFKRKYLSEQFVPYLIFVLILAFIIGYTTPVTGGIARYKTAFLPIFLSLCFLIVDSAKQNNKIGHQTKERKLKKSFAC